MEMINNDKPFWNIPKIVISLGFLVVISGGFWAYFKKDNAKQSLKDFSVFPVKVIKVQTQRVTPTINAIGNLEYFDKVNITSKTAGRIDRIYVKKGDFVKKGQALVSLEKLPLLLELKKNLASLNEAKSSYALSLEQYRNVRKKVEVKLKEIEKLRSQAKELKAKLTKMQNTFQGKQQLYKNEGISKEDFNSARLELLSTEAKYQAALLDLEIAEVGYRESDIKERGIKPEKSNAGRFKQLVDINSRIEKAEVAVAKSRVESAKVSVESTKILLNETIIRSPLYGIVALRNKAQGEEVSGGGVTNAEQSILVLVDIRNVYAKINVNEKDLKFIKNGMPVKFTVDALGDREFHGIVSHISPLVDTKTHTVEVKALLPNNDHKLTSGMFIRAKIRRGEKRNAIIIPSKAVKSKRDKYGYVFVVKKDRVYKIDVETGDEFGENVEITKGLKQDDLIAIEKLANLKTGHQIKPVIVK